MSKQDKLYKDAIVAAAVSGSNEVAEELLSYFVDIGNKECFTAMLYIRFDLLRPRNCHGSMASTTFSCRSEYNCSDAQWTE
jgi:hypothetical protein